MLGRATFTTVLSSITMNSPKQQAPRVSSWALRPVASTPPLSSHPAAPAPAVPWRLLRRPPLTPSRPDARRRRTSAWFVTDEGGDGRVAVLCKTPHGGNTGLVASDPHRFYLPRYVG